MLSKIYTILLVRWFTPSIITLFSGKKYRMEKGREMRIKKLSLTNKDTFCIFVGLSKY